VIHPHQFAASLQVAPYVYFISEWKPTHRFVDALFDTAYLGGTALILVNVPHSLLEEDLRAWFRAGLVGGDTEVIAVTKKIQRAGEGTPTGRRSRLCAQQGVCAHRVGTRQRVCGGIPPWRGRAMPDAMPCPHHPDVGPPSQSGA